MPHLQALAGGCRGTAWAPCGVTAEKRDEKERFEAPEGRSPYGSASLRKANSKCVNLHNEALASRFRDSLGAAHEEIDQRAEKVGKDDNDYPDQLVIALAGFLGCALNEHPDPEDRSEDPDAHEQQRDQGEQADAKDGSRVHFR